LGEEQIYPSELLLLGLWLGGPAFIAGLGAQAVFLWRKGLRRAALAAPIVASAILAYVLTYLLWFTLPRRLATLPAMSGDWPFMVLGIFFLPAVLAVIIVCPCATWLALRDRRTSASSGQS
jgi:arginine exporter protein ArgO